MKNWLSEVVKNMKRVLFKLGMGACVSRKKGSPSSSTMRVKLSFSTNNSASATATTTRRIAMVDPNPTNEASPGTKGEMFFDSRQWLESEDDEDYISLTNTPVRSLNLIDQGKKLSELFSESFNSESQGDEEEQELEAVASALGLSSGSKVEGEERKTNGCLPSLVRSLSCGRDRRTRASPVHIITS